jgi:hypothetical protein
MLKDREVSWRLSQPDRRLVLGFGLPWLLYGTMAMAQEPLTLEKLDKLAREALNEPDTTPLSNAKVLGFVESSLTTKSIERGNKASKYGFMVVIPPHDDGFVMFEGRDKPLYFVVHRTGTQLKRLASAINRNGKLSSWSGAEADASFAAIKSFWASVI